MSPFTVFFLLLIISTTTVHSVPLAADLHAAPIVSAGPNLSEITTGIPKGSSCRQALSRPSVVQFKPRVSLIKKVQSAPLREISKPIVKEYHSNLSNWVVADREDILQIKGAARGSAISFGLSNPSDSNQDIMLLQIVEVSQYQVYFAINKTSNDFLISVSSNGLLTSLVDNLQMDTIEWQFPASPTKDADSVHQGTLLDILNLNLDKFLYKDPDATVRINRGFSKIWEDLRPKVFKVMQNIIMQSYINKFHPKAMVVITGTALGGAVASIMAMDLVQSKIVNADRIKLTTFGAPQVGNQAFARTMDCLKFNSILRVFRENDKIPCFPGSKLGYVHFQGARYIANDGSVYVSDEDQDFLDNDDDDEPGLIPSIRAHKGMYDNMW